MVEYCLLFTSAHRLIHHPLNMESDKVVANAPGADGLQHRGSQFQPTYEIGYPKEDPSMNHDFGQQRYRNPWGLRPFAFGFLVFLITTITVGAIVGGSVSTLSNNGFVFLVIAVDALLTFQVTQKPSPRPPPPRQYLPHTPRHLPTFRFPHQHLSHTYPMAVPTLMVRIQTFTF